MPREKSAWIPYACTEYIDSTSIGSFTLNIVYITASDTFISTGVYVVSEPDPHTWRRRRSGSKTSVYGKFFTVLRLSDIVFREWFLPAKRDSRLEICSPGFHLFMIKKKKKVWSV